MRPLKRLVQGDQCKLFPYVSVGAGRMNLPRGRSLPHAKGIESSTDQAERPHGIY